MREAPNRNASEGSLKTLEDATLHELGFPFDGGAARGKLGIMGEFIGSDPSAENVACFPVRRKSASRAMRAVALEPILSAGSTPTAREQEHLNKKRRLERADGGWHAATPVTALLSVA